MNPEAPLALRLSGQLLLGVVKIYNKQIIYLYEDCNDILSKLQLVSLLLWCLCYDGQSYKRAHLLFVLQSRHSKMVRELR